MEFDLEVSMETVSLNQNNKNNQTVTIELDKKPDGSVFSSFKKFKPNFQFSIGFVCPYITI